MIRAVAEVRDKDGGRDALALFRLFPFLIAPLEINHDQRARWSGQRKQLKAKIGAVWGKTALGNDRFAVRAHGMEFESSRAWISITLSKDCARAELSQLGFEVQIANFQIRFVLRADSRRA